MYVYVYVCLVTLRSGTRRSGTRRSGTRRSGTRRGVQHGMSKSGTVRGVPSAVYPYRPGSSARRRLTLAHPWPGAVDDVIGRVPGEELGRVGLAERVR